MVRYNLVLVEDRQKYQQEDDVDAAMALMDLSSEPKGHGSP